MVVHRQTWCWRGGREFYICIYICDRETLHLAWAFETPKPSLEATHFIKQGLPCKVASFPTDQKFKSIRLWWPFLFKPPQWPIVQTQEPAGAISHPNHSNCPGICRIQNMLTLCGLTMNKNMLFNWTEPSKVYSSVEFAIVYWECSQKSF